MKAKRYFIVTYEAICENGRRIVGDKPFTSDSGKYVNQKNVTKYIQDRAEQDGDEIGKIKHLLFRNIIELNKEDFEEYIR